MSTVLPLFWKLHTFCILNVMTNANVFLLTGLCGDADPPAQAGLEESEDQQQTMSYPN